jgi:hypothetical protein
MAFRLVSLTTDIRGVETRLVLGVACTNWPQTKLDTRIAETMLMAFFNILDSLFGVLTAYRAEENKASPICKEVRKRLSNAITLSYFCARTGFEAERRLQRVTFRLDRRRPQA